MTPDPSHFTRAATRLGDKRSVVAGSAVFNAQGQKIIDKGVRVDSRLYERLSEHRLQAPLADCLEVESPVSAAQLADLARNLVAQHDLLDGLLDNRRQRDHLFEELSLVPLPGPVAFQLSVMAETWPDGWQHALRSMVVAGWLGGQVDGGTRYDMRMLATAGLLCDLGMLHADPVLQRPRQQLDGGQRRHLFSHPLVSVMLLEPHTEYPRQLLRAVLEHHEMLDGSGYPRGVAGADLSPWGRILGVTNLVAGIIATELPQASRRLSVVLRMNEHRYDQNLSTAVQRALRIPAEASAPNAEASLQALRSIQQLLSAWPRAPQEGLPASRQAATLVLTAQCDQLQRVMAGAGVGGDALEMLARESLDAAGSAELVLIAGEAMWQLRAFGRLARRRINVLDAPLPGWLEDWLEQADRLCASQLSDAATSPEVGADDDTEAAEAAEPAEPAVA